MPGILPDTESAGAVVVRDANGNPTNPPNVQNAYSPHPAFVSTCQITALPSDCEARVEPRQINAIVSELISFAECLYANGPWDCNSTKNLCAAFNARVAAQTTLAAVLISDLPPPNPVHGTLWWESDSGLLWVFYNDGDSAQWVIAVPKSDTTRFVLRTGDTMSGPLSVPTQPTSAAHAASKAYVDGVIGATQTDINNRVRYDAPQALTTAQQAQARTNIAAAPTDALAYSGLQINGSIEISQELGMGGSTQVNNTYGCDGWKMQQHGSMQTALGAYPSTVFNGFTSRLGLGLVTPQVTLAAADNVFVQQYIEGYRVARLAWGTAGARPITLAFWTAHHRTGIYSGVVSNAASNRSYAFSYTQNVSDAPEYKTVTIKGDTAGVWQADNGIGMQIVFSAGAGATFVAPLVNTWLSGNYTAAPGQVNAVASVDDKMYFTGVVILPGTEAPTAERSPYIMRSFDQELPICQRYYFKYVMTNDLTDHRRLTRVVLGTGSVLSNALYGKYDFPVEMRTLPTFIFGGSWRTNSGLTIGVPTMAENGRRYMAWAATCTAPDASSYQVQSVDGPGGFIAADARL